ncbi:hypothetical protein A2U01_0055968, partial [Trifolium medium]|nr:hypothetical protein [Trifolium medium]
PVGKGKALLLEDVPSTRKKVVKHSGTGSSAVLVEALPSVERGCHGSMPTRTCIYPPLPLGGTKTEVENLRKLLRETTSREEDVVERLSVSEFQVLTLSKRLKDYEHSEVGLLRKKNAELESR